MSTPLSTPERKREITRLQELVYELRVRDAMTTRVITVTPQTTIAEFREVLRANRISGTPVVDEGQMVGIISIGELITEVDQKRVCLLAVDQGPGIPDIQKAMEPGFSTAPELREMGFGAGMGLPNIQDCADEMRLESTVGVGTRLEIIFYLDSTGRS